MKKEIFIIGGGTSLKEFNFDLLKDKTTIAINKSLFYVPNPDYFITTDYTFLTKIKPISIMEFQDTSKFFVVNLNRKCIVEKDGCFKDTRGRGLVYDLKRFDSIIKSYKKEGISDNWSDFRNGNNSGKSALQLAYLLGFEKIYLLGMDMKAGLNNKHWFHEGYKSGGSWFTKYVDEYYEDFKNSCIEINKSGKSKVINCSSISRLINDIGYIKIEKVLYGTFKRFFIFDNKKTDKNINKEIEEPKEPFKDKLVFKQEKKMKPIIISYATEGCYEDVLAKNLKPGLEKFNLEHDIEIIENFKSWQSNTYYKATFIKRKMEELKRDIIWIDVDATIEKYPELLYNIPEEYDLGIFYLDWYLHWRNQPNKDKRELISATMFFRYNNNSLKVLNDWVETNKTKIKTGIWEQKVLQEVLDKNTGAKIFPLPPEYNAITLHNKKVPDYIKEPVIIQHQASREHKGDVNKPKKTEPKKKKYYWR